LTFFNQVVKWGTKFWWGIHAYSFCFVYFLAYDVISQETEQHYYDTDDHSISKRVTLICFCFFGFNFYIKYDL